MSNLHADAAGFYGKLPVVGDFVQRRLSQDFIIPWDQWLQNSMFESQQQLGELWLNQYLKSPIWRFVLSPGVCGHAALAGILMPSVDKVGRYYPLTIAAAFENAHFLPYLFTSGQHWFELLEDIALNGLENNLELEEFDLLIKAIPEFGLPEQSKNENSSIKKSFCISLSNPAQLPEAFIGLTANLLSSLMPGYSLWYSEGCRSIQPVLIAYEGLPAINDFSFFLTGRATEQSRLIKQAALFYDNQKQLAASFQPIDSNSLNLAWDSWGITDTGKRRTHNEDSMLVKPDIGLWAVADGMGGHQAGDIASQMVVKQLNAFLPSDSFENNLETLKQSLQTVNADLRDFACRQFGEQFVVGSTIVTLFCQGEKAAFLWAGDSRLYLFRDNRLQQLTKDHCESEYSDDTQTLKSSNIITRAVGADNNLLLDSNIERIVENDLFLLCSDGLDKELSFTEIEAIIRENSAPELANRLLNEALERGAIDNVTIIVVAIKSI